MSSHYETIVVGLGAAGATAASMLARAGKRVLALEAQDRIGGRVHTVQFGDGVVELGAEWIHGSSPSRVYEAAIQANITPIPQDLDMSYYLSDGVKPGAMHQELFNELVEYIFLVASQGSDRKETLGAFAKRSLIEYIEESKPELRNQKEFINYVLDYTHQLMNNYNASNDWEDVDAQGKYEELDGHQHLSWHRHGYKTFFDILLNKEIGYPTLDIKLNTEVTQISWSQDSGKKVEVSCRDGAVYTANNIIVTVSLGVLKERHETLFKPKLPETKVKAIQNISMGVMDKIDLAFDEVWWPHDCAFYGLLWREQDKKLVPENDNWMTKVFAASRPMGAKNVLTLWTSGEVAKYVETLPIDVVKTKCKELLQRFMGKNITVPEPKAIERSTWHTNPYTLGSYSYDSFKLPTGSSRSVLRAPILDAIGTPKILFAGEAVHDTHYSTVHGASETGYTAALALLGGSKL